MHILIYSAGRENPFVFGRGKTALWISGLLLAASLWGGTYYGMQAARVEKSLEMSGRQIELLRVSLARADSAAEYARGKRARVEDTAFGAYVGSLERTSLFDAPDTVIVARGTGGLRFALQVSSHRSREEAARFAARIGAALSRRVEIDSVQVAGTAWHRVLIDRFPSRNAARAFGDSLVRSGVIREHIVQERGERP